MLHCACLTLNHNASSSRSEHEVCTCKVSRKREKFLEYLTYNSIYFFLSYRQGVTPQTERKDVLWTWSHEETQALYPRHQISGMRHYNQVLIYNYYYYETAWSILGCVCIDYERVYRKKAILARKKIMNN